VAGLLRADLFELEECALLGQLPGVRALAQRLRRGVFPTGLAIRTLLDRAVGEVELHSCTSGTRSVRPSSLRPRCSS
jgi:hypothetical protein